MRRDEARKEKVRGNLLKEHTGPGRTEQRQNQKKPHQENNRKSCERNRGRREE